MKTTDRLVVPAEVSQLDTVLEFICARLNAADCPPEKRELIAIAAEEIFVNIAHYAYGQARGMVRLGCAVKKRPRCAVIEFADSGIPYNPFLRPDPDLDLGAHEREVGGLGIYMVKSSMDEVGYEYKDGFNVLTIKKKL